MIAGSNTSMKKKPAVRSAVDVANIAINIFVKNSDNVISMYTSSFNLPLLSHTSP